MLVPLVLSNIYLRLSQYFEMPKCVTKDLESSNGTSSPPSICLRHKEQNDSSNVESNTSTNDDAGDSSAGGSDMIYVPTTQ